MSLVRCSGCYEKISSEADVCPRCGHGVNVKLYGCPECGGEFRMGDTTCDHCGFPVSDIKKRVQKIHENRKQEKREMVKNIIGIFFCIFLLYFLFTFDWDSKW